MHWYVPSDNTFPVQKNETAHDSYSINKSNNYPGEDDVWVSIGWKLGMVKKIVAVSAVSEKNHCGVHGACCG